ncbi:YfbR-like 5'-deoxynucleotidase [Bartonella sp. DGB1]|uniref:YfbR-like 5'-deoxynucleotidase n=1 Tax=Bartonella sp. DGB1 TaxID=3239807 RepID=UPI003523DAF5
MKKTIRVWQRMLSGRRLDLILPSALDIEINDIARGLSRLARWNGQTKGKYPFSVAQHSLLVLYIFKQIYLKSTKQDQLYALLHDASEYVIGDMISPFKQVIGDNYKKTEKNLEQAIYQSFGLNIIIDRKIKKYIKMADITAAFYEAIFLAGFEKSDAFKYFGTPLLDHIPMQYFDNKDNTTIEQEFLARF